MIDKIKKAIEIYERLQENAYAVVTSEDSPELLKKKVGTILLFSVMEKINQGKSPNSFSTDDWKDVAEDISEYAVLMEGDKYSAFVFLQYANYIDASVEFCLNHISEDTKKQIASLAEELRSKTEDFRNGRAKEVDYVDDCLWISMEAMIKLLASYAERFAGEERGQFAQAVSGFSIAYARYVVCSKELERINGYFYKQQEVDSEIRKQLENCQSEIDEKSREFNLLLNHAFDEDFRIRLMNSARLAVVAGVSDDEVLDSMEKLDAFFM